MKAGALLSINFSREREKEGDREEERRGREREERKGRVLA